MAVVSVDLASRRYRDVGVAVLGLRSGGIRCEFPRPGAVLSGSPDPQSLASWLEEQCLQAGARHLLIDGPQAWKGPGNGLEHQRLCERELHTPGKTGEPGAVKPRTWLRFAEFSIALFDALDALGWHRLDSNDPAAPGMHAVESFPTAAWRSLRLTPLPSKSRARRRDVSERVGELTARFPLDLEREPNHDELQALVAGLGGLALALKSRGSFRIVGDAPRREGGAWREGFIVIPRPLVPGLRWRRIAALGD